jgi:TM2 domain
MKKQAIIIAMVFALVLTAIPFAYAAFPVSGQKETTTATTASGTSNSSVVNAPEAVTENAVIKPAADHSGHGGSGKSQVIALILVILVGGLGIHRFYLGYTWQGVVQLLTGGGCGIWAIIDLIRIITGDLQPKNGSYSKTL